MKTEETTTAGPSGPPSFLKDLPSHRKENFSKYGVDGHPKAPMDRPPVYIPKSDGPQETSQLIVTEKRAFLLRYLHAQWEKNIVNSKKHSAAAESPEADPTGQTSSPRRKMPRKL